MPRNSDDQGHNVLLRPFRVLQPVLSQTRDEICSVYDLGKAEAFARVEAFVKSNSENWRLPQPDIEYEDPLCRMAYLYMNVAVHTHLVDQALGAYGGLGRSMLRRIEAGEEIRVCALGGGPGSELLGFVRYVQSLNAGKPAYVDFLLVDRIKEWEESWHALKTGVDAQLRDAYGPDRSLWPIVISRSFLPLDVSLLSDFENLASRFAGIDLFLACYLASELKGKVDQFRQVVELLIRRSSAGAWFLFIDRNERTVREAVVELVGSIRSLVPLGLIQHRGRLAEPLDDLGEWYINIETLPRQRWLAFFVLAQKD